MEKVIWTVFMLCQAPRGSDMVGSLDLQILFLYLYTQDAWFKTKHVPRCCWYGEPNRTFLKKDMILHSLITKIFSTGKLVKRRGSNLSSGVLTKNFCATFLLLLPSIALQLVVATGVTSPPSPFQSLFLLFGPLPLSTSLSRTLIWGNSDPTGELCIILAIPFLRTTDKFQNMNPNPSIKEPPDFRLTLEGRCSVEVTENIFVRNLTLIMNEVSLSLYKDLKRRLSRILDQQFSTSLISENGENLNQTKCHANKSAV